MNREGVRSHGCPATLWDNAAYNFLNVVLAFLTRVIIILYILYLLYILQLNSTYHIYSSASLIDRRFINRRPPQIFNLL